MFRKIIYRFNNELTKEQQIEVLGYWDTLRSVVKKWMAYQYLTYVGVVVLVILHMRMRMYPHTRLSS